MVQIERVNVPDLDCPLKTKLRWSFRGNTSAVEDKKKNKKHKEKSLLRRQREDGGAASCLTAVEIWLSGNVDELEGPRPRNLSGCRLFDFGCPHSSTGSTIRGDGTPRRRGWRDVTEERCGRWSCTSIRSGVHLPPNKGIWFCPKPSDWDRTALFILKSLPDFTKVPQSLLFFSLCFFCPWHWSPLSMKGQYHL